jgi:hypothetical protein
MTTDSVTFDMLATVKKGDKFLHNGFNCIAYADAEVSTNKFTGEERVFIQAGREHGGMPSGYCLADILEYYGEAK